MHTGAIEAYEASEIDRGPGGTPRIAICASAVVFLLQKAGQDAPVGFILRLCHRAFAVHNSSKRLSDRRWVV